MTKVVFVSKNHLLIERITAYINAREDMTFLLFATTRPNMIMDEIDAFVADVVLIDAMSIEESDILCMCSQIADSSYSCKCMILTEHELKEVWVNDLEQKQLIAGIVSIKDNLDEVFQRILDNYYKLRSLHCKM